MELVLIREDAGIMKWVSKYELDHEEGIRSSDKQHMQSFYKVLQHHCEAAQTGGSILRTRLEMEEGW